MIINRLVKIMEIVKQLMIEYILTNGTLPDFKKRVENSIPYWDSSDEEFTVFRGQGHTKKGIPKPVNSSPNELRNFVRPVISTSSDKNYVLNKFTDYSEKKEGICCLFKIKVSPGIRFLDFSKLPNEYITKYSIKEFMDMKKVLDPDNQLWPSNKLPYERLLSIVKTRKENEKEILLDGYQGTFTILDDGSNIANNGRSVRVMDASYSLKVGGRRKTRKVKRINKRNTRKY
jgi:hypothetical protein